jgi:uncharacterized protein YtpQ (UPF0354 family)
VNSTVVSFAALLIIIFAIFLVRANAATNSGDPGLLSPEQFTKEFIAAAKVAEPDAEIKVRKPLKLVVTAKNGAVGTPDLGNAYLAYKKSPHDLEAIIATYVDVIMNFSKNKDDDKTLDQLLPVIHGEEFMAVAERQLADLRERGKAPLMGGMVSAKLADGLYVLYVFDRPKRYSYVTENDARQLKLSEPELRKIALANLKRLYLPKLKVSETNGLYQLILDGNYESSMILLTDELNKPGNFNVHVDLVTYVLARDTVFITGSDEHEAQATVESFISKTPDISYAITQDPYVLKLGTWVPYHR